MFQQEPAPAGTSGVVHLTGEFYTADIRLDGIISYPWLKENRLGVFPHMGALAAEDPFVLLKVFSGKKRKVKPSAQRDIQMVVEWEVSQNFEPPPKNVKTFFGVNALKIGNYQKWKVMNFQNFWTKKKLDFCMNFCMLDR